MALGFQKFDDLEKILPEQLKVTGRKLQCLVCGVIVLLVIVCLVLSVSLGLHANGRVGPCSAGARASRRPCTTTECLETAARLSENMDVRVDPCRDFHKYACAGWSRRHAISPDAGDVTVLKKLQLENDERIRELVEKPIRRDDPESSERKMKQFFRMCLHDYGRMREAGRGLWRLIQKHVGGWFCQDPDGWTNNGWSLNDAISDIQAELNVDVFLRINIALDWRTRVPLIRIYQSGTGMFYRYYLREDKEGVQEAYKDYIRQAAVLLMRDANVTLTTSEQNRRVEQFVSDAYGQELQLAQIQHDIRAARGGSGYRSRTVTIKELETNYTQLPWRQIVRRAFDGFNVDDSTKVRIDSLGYFRKINELLRNETTNKDRITNNYIVWRVLKTYSRYLSWEYKHAAYRYYEIAYGQREFQPTWDECLMLTKHLLAPALTAELVKHYTDREAKQEVEEMYSYVKSAFSSGIRRLHWMDNETKSRAEQKVAALRSTIAFPDSFFNDTYLDSVLAKLQVNTSDGFFQTFVNAERFQRSFRTQALQGGAAAGSTFVYAADGYTGGSRPSYLWRSNHLLVPFGAMQLPLYGRTRPSFVNFGGLGSQMADETSTSVNRLGRYIWTNGSWANWWTAQTEASYNEAKKCFADFFDGMKIGPFFINGQNRTVKISGRFQSARAIDIVAGIKTSLTAYHDRMADTGDELVPVGLNLTADQAFFVSAAQTQCFVRTDALSYNYARYQYIPEDILFNGALSHMPEFASTFRCQANSPMVVNKTCNVF